MFEDAAERLFIILITAKSSFALAKVFCLVKLFPGKKVRDELSDVVNTSKFELSDIDPNKICRPHKLYTRPGNSWRLNNAFSAMFSGLTAQLGGGEGRRVSISAAFVNLFCGLICIAMYDD